MKSFIRWYNARDLKQVIALTGYTIEQFNRENTKRHQSVMVVESINENIDACFILAFEERRIVLKEFSVANVSEYSNMTHLVVDYIKQRLNEERSRICIAIHETDLRGQLAFKAEGLEWTETLKFDGEDYYCMEYHYLSEACYV